MHRIRIIGMAAISAATDLDCMWIQECNPENDILTLTKNESEAGVFANVGSLLERWLYDILRDWTIEVSPCRKQ